MNLLESVCTAMWVFYLVQMYDVMMWQRWTNISSSMSQMLYFLFVLSQTYISLAVISYEFTQMNNMQIIYYEKC